MTQDEVNQAEWEAGNSWTYGLYRSERDSRVFVPTRQAGRGTTLNFAHKSWPWAMLGLLIVPIALLVGLLVSRIAR